MVIFGPITELVKIHVMSSYILLCTFQFLPTGLHGLCFGFCFAGPLPLRSLTHGLLLRVRFGESLVFRLYSEISTLAVKLSVPAIIYPRWTATGPTLVTFFSNIFVSMHTMFFFSTCSTLINDVKT